MSTPLLMFLVFIAITLGITFWAAVIFFGRWTAYNLK